MDISINGNTSTTGGDDGGVAPGTQRVVSACDDRVDAWIANA